MRIAIYGGSFDPIHSGHLEIIDYLSKTYDKVIVIPTTVKYYKKNICMFSFNERYKAVLDKVSNYDNVEVSDIERNAPDTWRYFHTLCEIKKEYPDDELFTVMGSDSINTFDTWEQHKNIAALSKIVVVTRPGYKIEKNSEYIDSLVTNINNTASSTALRSKLNMLMSDEDFEEFLMDVGWDIRESIAN